MNSNLSKVRSGRDWLNGAVGYEIYSRSFSDSTGDGFGDLKGITQRLEYLAWLGVDIVWLTPIYPSPDHDHGYDVSDFKSVRSEHGTVADVEELVERAHELGLKVIMDIVPNHTSSEHEWFKKALADPSSPERDMYLFRDPAPDGGPPNNWVSHFGGSAWELDEASGQYYLHLFVTEQPDLNWRNPAVLEAFDDIFHFWFKRGIDGFRIDVAHGLLKHESFADNPQKVVPPETAGPLERFFSFEHKYDLDQDGNAEIFNRWQTLAADYDATMLAESGVDDHQRLARYVSPETLDLTFFLKTGWMRWEPAKLVDEFCGLAAIEDKGISWIISNHDQPRPVSRLTEEIADAPDRFEIGQARSMALTVLQMALGGVPFLYYGEELGLPDGEVDPNRREDPVATRNKHSAGEARDVARTPMPWDSSKFNGFSESQPWIHCAERPAEHTVEGQRANPEAPVHAYRQLLQIRKAHPDLYSSDFERLPAPSAEVAVIGRGSTITVANLGASEVTVELPEGEWATLFASKGSDGLPVCSGQLKIGPERSVILSSGESPA